MTNAMPPLQMMIKLSYGWRPLPLPCIVISKHAKMYGDFAKGHEFAVHCFFRYAVLPGGASPSPTVFLDRLCKSDFCKCALLLYYCFSGFSSFSGSALLTVSLTVTVISTVSPWR